MKFKHKKVKKKILTSFLTFSLLLSTSMNLNANELKQEKQTKPNFVVLEDDFKVYLPNPSNLETKKLPFRKLDEVSRFYAHRGVYIVKNDKILFNNFGFRSNDFKQPFNHDSELLSTDFLQIKKDHFNDYLAIFTFFKDGTFRYFVFKEGSENVIINTVRIPKFDVPDDAQIRVGNYDPGSGRYNIFISSSEFEKNKVFMARMILTGEKNE